MRLPLLLAVITVLCARVASASGVVIVAPETPMPPYQEALQGVCDALGACPPVLKAGDNLSIPADVKVIIAIGGRAARLSYPAHAALVTALSPGYEARTGRDAGPVTRLQLTYSPSEFAQRLKTLLPKARRAILLWSGPGSGRFAAAVRTAAAPLELDAVPVQVQDPEEIPALLRSLPAADAVWLAPDPTLVTPMTFDAAREYARSRGAAFFAPAPGLADRGADPSLAPSFRAAGLRAGALAVEIMSGKTAPDQAYPEIPEEAKKLIVSSVTHIEPAR